MILRQQLKGISVIDVEAMPEHRGKLIMNPKVLKC